MRARPVIALLVACWSTSSSAITFADRDNITSPKTNQVFQRSGTTGTIVVSGSVRDSGNAHDIEANVDGGAFTTVATGATTTFSGNLTSVAQGVHTVRVRWKDAVQTHIDIPNVGIGDIFLLVGQSNAVGQGTVNQVYIDHSNIAQGVSPFASIFGGDYTWRRLADKVGYQTGWVDSVNDNSGSTLGSLWPLVASKYAASVNIPIAVIPCAKVGVAIASWLPGADHLDRATLYGACNYRAQQVTATVKGVLMWEGESDATATCTSQATFQANLQTIADAFYADLGSAITIPIKLQQGTGMSCETTINAAIDAARAADPSHIAVPADFSNLNADDAYHLSTDINIRCAAGYGVTVACATVSLWSAMQTAFSYP